MNDISKSVPKRDCTLFLRCPFCAGDSGEPLGVTDSFDGTLASSVVLRCGGCSAVYLAPVGDEVARSVPAVGYNPRLQRRLHRIARQLPARARILLVDGMPGGPLESLSAGLSRSWTVKHAPMASLQRPAAEGEQFDLILMAHALECSGEPIEFLRGIGTRLAEGGRAVMVAGNADSSCFRAFGGRHWSGYCLPQGRQYLTGDACRKLSTGSGLAVRKVSTLFANEMWLASLRNCLHDWDARQSTIRIATGNWMVPQLVAALIESIAVLRGKGALLAVELERP